MKFGEVASTGKRVFAVSVAHVESEPAPTPAITVVQALAKGTESFAATRMNEGIRKALAGKNLEAI